MNKMVINDGVSVDLQHFLLWGYGDKRMRIVAETFKFVDVLYFLDYFEACVCVCVVYE